MMTNVTPRVLPENPEIAGVQPISPPESAALTYLLNYTGGVSPTDAVIRINREEQTPEVLRTLNPREEKSRSGKLRTFVDREKE